MNTLKLTALQCSALQCAVLKPIAFNPNSQLMRMIYYALKLLVFTCNTNTFLVKLASNQKNRLFKNILLYSLPVHFKHSKEYKTL